MKEDNIHAAQGLHDIAVRTFIKYATDIMSCDTHWTQPGNSIYKQPQLGHDKK
jgi:hypothetical protein